MKDRIFLMDSDPKTAESLKQVLQDNAFEITPFTKTAACLSAIEAQSPDLLITEVHLPDMPGFEFCQQVLKLENCADLPVIFLSDLNDIQSISHGYEVGGSDYITKPFNTEEITKKIQLFLKNRHHAHTLNSQAKKAKKVAIDAMNDTERLSQVVKFMEHCVREHDLTIITNRIFEILRSQGLHSSILIATNNTYHYFSDDKIDKPLEKQLLIKAHETLYQRIDVTGRYYKLNARMVISCDHVSLFIRNYNEEEHANTLDFLGGLLNSIEIKMFALDAIFQRIQTKKKEAQHLLNDAEKNLQTLSNTLNTYEGHILNIINVILGELGVKLAALDLQEDIEASLMELIEKSMNELITIYAKGLNLEKPLRQVLEDIRLFIEEMIETGYQTHSQDNTKTHDVFTMNR